MMLEKVSDPVASYGELPSSIRSMKITDVQTIRFKYTSNTVRDTDGHGHPGPEHEATETLLKITTDEGAEGHWFGANPSACAAKSMEAAQQTSTPSAP